MHRKAMTRLRDGFILEVRRVGEEHSRSIKSRPAGTDGWSTEQCIVHAGKQQHGIGVSDGGLEDEAQSGNLPGGKDVFVREVDLRDSPVVQAGVEGRFTLCCRGRRDVSQGYAGVALGRQGGGGG